MSPRHATADRDPRFDNLRGLLMYLVVFAHALALLQGFEGGAVYQVVYSFHMPAFVLLTGWFARCTPKRLLQLALLYAVAQPVYLAASWALRGCPGALELQWATPYWLLWYLVSTFWWLLLAALLPRGRAWAGPVLVAASAAAAVAVGFAEEAGRVASLSRTVVYLPFFVAGFYLRRSNVLQALDAHRAPIAGALGACVVAGCVLLVGADLPSRALYGSFSYVATGTGPLERAGLLALGAAWCGLLLACVPRRRVGALAHVGACTMAVFVLHGLVLLPMRVTGGVQCAPEASLAIAAVFAAALTWALARPTLDRALRFGFLLDRRARSARHAAAG